MLTMMLDPLVGEEISYLVPPDGSRIDMVDPGQLWERVAARMEKAGAEADRPEARQLAQLIAALPARSEEHTSELQSLMRISYAVFCLKKKKKENNEQQTHSK